MRIMVTTDGSELSFAALPHAAHIASALDADLTLLYVLDPARELPDDDAAASRSAVSAVAKQRADELTDRAAGLGTPTSVHVAIAGEDERPADAILRTAAARRARLLVMSTHGAGVVRRAVAGSVAAAVLRGARTPVMFVGQGAQPPERTLPYGIVLGTDGSEAAEALLPAAGKLLAGVPRENVVLTLLRVYQPAYGDPPLEDALDLSRQELMAFRRRAPRRFALDLDVREEPALGAVRDGIFEAAKEHSADAIWMATHGHSFARQLLMGSTALGVVQDANLPVILSRAQG